MLAKKLTVLFVLLSASLVVAQEKLKKGTAPSADAQSQATKLVKEVYASEFAAAKSPDQKKNLAKMLLGKAGESATDPTGQYALLRLSHELAIQALDLPSALQIVQEMDKAFEVDALALKNFTLSKFIAAFTTPDQHRVLSQLAGELAEEAASQDRFELAQQFNDSAEQEARKANDKALSKIAADRKTELEEIAKSYGEMKAALAVLEKTPADPAANLIVGKYKSVIRREWESGLPMLALGNDPKWKALAEAELKGATATEGQTSLGDQWWELSDAQGSFVKKQIRARAAYWYRLALPSLTGLSKDKVERRLAELAAAVVPVVKQPKQTFKVAANKMNWTETLKVRKGQTIVVTATGIWSPTKNSPMDADGGGSRDGMEHWGGLIGKIGETSFFVGKKYSGTVGEDGVLQLRINDGDRAKNYEDNAGELIVTVEVK